MAPRALRRASFRCGGSDRALPRRRAAADASRRRATGGDVGGRLRTLALPPLTEAGELPAGVHPALLSEIRARFGVGSVRRTALIQRLERIYRVAQATGHLARFLVFGSFVTSKPEPQDVDLFLVMADTFDASELMGDMRLLFDHGAAQAHFGASVFWIRRRAAWPDERVAVEFWQVKRGGGRRGIVEIIREAV